MACGYSREGDQGYRKQVDRKDQPKDSIVVFLTCPDPSTFHWSYSTEGGATLFTHRLPSLMWTPHGELPRGDCFADSTPLGFNTTRIPHF